MRHIITVLLTTVFFICMNSMANAATTQNKEVSLKKPLIKEDLTKSTRIAKKAKAKKMSKKSLVSKKVVLDMDKKPKKKIKGKVIAKKNVNKNKKYWSVECKQGFIKDSYVYCARSIASVNPSKKINSKKVAMKKSKVVMRK
jgi:hypothetical protein